MMMSIVHRATGIILYAGVLLLVWWLVAAAISDAYFDMVQAFFGHWFGLLVMFGFTWALIHHFIGGIRHLIWDMGSGFELPSVERGAKLTIAASVLLTIVLWAIGFGVMP
jgi:succinate dehydrogenase / fumarate reductase cytochrome b subunit